MKRAAFALCMMFVLLTIGGAMVFAQDEATPIAYGDVVEGEVTGEDFDDDYVFVGSEGDLVMVEMLPETARPSESLDPKLQLKNAGDEIIFEDDDFIYPSAVMITSLPEDGEYTITATRYNTEVGTTVGTYTLRLTMVEPLTLGETVNTQIFPINDDEVVLPEFIVLRVPEDTTVQVSMEVSEGELFAALHIATPDYQTYGSYGALLDFDPSIAIRHLSFEMELVGEQIYVVYVSRAFASYSEADAAPVDVSITVAAAE